MSYDRDKWPEHPVSVMVKITAAVMVAVAVGACVVIGWAVIQLADWVTTK